MQKIDNALSKAGYETELTPDEEHGLWEIETMTRSGINMAIDWNFASYVEFQKAVELFKSLEDDLSGPFISGENGTSEEVPTREALLEKVLAAAKKGPHNSAIQRSGRDEPGTALGNNNESRQTYAAWKSESTTPLRLTKSLPC